MKIAYVVPGPMSKGPMGATEVKRRERLLNQWAFEGTSAKVEDVETGPSSIESAYEEMLAIPATLDLIRDCERNGYDAAIIGCFGDPGLEAARELVRMPVVGPAESSMLLAASLGHKFSVLTIYDSLIAGQEHLAHKAGVAAKLASVRATNIAVLDLMRDRALTLERLIEVGRACVKQDRADSILLGCMTMSFLDVAETVSAEIGVPVINAGKAALKHAEMLVSQGLTHSLTAYAPPPKLADANQPEVLSA
ncbi:MAG: aspartate/glutamate racemase family protein [Pseudomonadota bacterium]